MKLSFRKTSGLKAAHAPGALSRLHGAGTKRFAPALICSLAALAMGVPAASSAGTLYNGWNYAIDSFSDGSGGTAYEELSLAFRQSGSTGYFAISGGMPLTGVPVGGALNGSIAPGDLYLNFSAHNLDAPAKFNDSKVFGVRFASANDSLGNTASTPNTTLGLFTNLSVANLAPVNSGYGTLQAYYNSGYSQSPQMGDLGTQAAVVAYLGNGAMYANITAGSKLEDIVSLTAADLLAAGLDLAHFSAAGSQVFGFKLDLSALPTGEFTAHFLEECINDGIALRGSHVPEPGTLALLSLGLVGIRLRRRR